MSILKLRSSDKIVFEVEEDIAVQSETIKSLIECCAADNEIPLTNVAGVTLAMVIEWCKKHAAGTTDASATVDLKKWEAEFVDKDQAELFHLIMAANYLNIMSLLDAVSEKVANMMKGKKPEEIRKIFHIKNDFSPEEEEKIRKDNPWAFE